MNLSRAALIFSVAFGLRAGAAIVDHHRLIFPDHHYADAREYHEEARRLVALRRSGNPPPGLSQGKESYIHWTAALYSAFGESPLLPRLINAAAGAGAVLIWYFILASLFRLQTADITIALAVFWPSHIFYSGQHLKESAVMLFSALIFAVFLAEGMRPFVRLRRLAAGASAVALLGLFRPQFLPFFGAAVLVFALHRALQKEFKAAFLLAAWFFAGAGLSPVFKSLTASSGAVDSAELVAAETAAPHTTSLFTARGVSAYRKARLEGSAHWSLQQRERKIETQIFPDAEFLTWLDIACFLPKASFYSLFMPLPGLYPLEGKLGRMVAAAENTVLLVLFLTALAGIRKFQYPSAGALLCVFFLTAVPAAAFLEFDLGSAARHKLVYFPVLLPFIGNAFALWSGAQRRQ